MSRWIPIAALALVATPAMAQESLTNQCITGTDGQEVCVETRLYLKPEEPPVEPPIVTLPKDPSADAGAEFPISYVLADECSGSCTVRYLAPTGSGSACTQAAPCGSITTANNIAKSGDLIVLRGGTYALGATWDGSTWTGEQFLTTNGIKFMAYPGERVVFDGSADITNGPWTAEGSYKYTAYIDRPCTTGSGINFCAEGVNDNVNGNATTFPYRVGRWPDQVWLDDERLREVESKSQLATGMFWIDRANNHVYLMKAQADTGASVDVCGRGDLMAVHGSGITIKGIELRRFCNTAARGAPIDIAATADGLTMQDVAINESSYSSLLVIGTSGNLLEDVTLRDITIEDANWMGINPVYTTGLDIDGLRCTGMDPWNEFDTSPQAGCVKTSRTFHTTMQNSYIANSSSQGVWFDESNHAVTFANNTIDNASTSAGSCVFFEISDLFYMVNNYIRCPHSISAKAAGASGLYIANNTLIGGPDTLGLYNDGRSFAGCAATGTITATGANCSTVGAINSNYWKPTQAGAPPLPPTMTWLLSVDLVMNNIIQDPTSVGYCGGLAGLCIQRTYGAGSPNTPFNTVIHPGTDMDCNVYAGAGQPIRIGSPTSTSATIGYDTPQAFGAAMDDPAPYPGLAGLEANSLVGTASLDHTQACTLPAIGPLRDYVTSPHWGVSWQ